LAHSHDEILARLNAQPLGEAIASILAEDSAVGALQEQVAALENQLAGHVAHGARQPLQEALDKVREAQRMSALPLHLAISKAITKIARDNGLLIKQPQGGSAGKAPGGTRKHYSPDEIRQKVAAALPADAAEGLAGNALAEKCGVSYQTLRKHLDDLAANRVISRVGEGRSTRWVRGRSD